MPWDSAKWDAWYELMEASPQRDSVVAEALDLPVGFASNNLLPWAAADRLVSELELAEGQLLIDLACGRGAWGLELAGRSGARLIGVDWSDAALRAARRRAADGGLDGNAEFRLGSLGECGLATAEADAVTCLDSIQFADPIRPALVDALRILRPGGRLVLTSWEPGRRGDERLDPSLRLRDLGAQLADAGFADVCVSEQPQWYAAERRLWDRVGLEASDDAAVRALQVEARRVLETVDQLRRVLVTGRKPG